MTRVEELVEAAVAGDRSAFAQLLELNGKQAYVAALSVLGSPEEARDAVQEGALRAWQQLPALRDRSAWPAWFRRICVRAAIDASRRARRVREIRLFEASAASERDTSTMTDALVSVQAAMKVLSAEDRALLGLRYGADLTVPEAAAALGLNVGTAKARLHRSLAKLRAELDRDG
ncbi:MAG TPA: sigma-70 family RNA polymerase sigma factor [Candidatus Limnocylindria bacterium]|nr:sigma-70 family RNA polymerase sigma factor [Candidatus Limnocylindria bacterium]